MTYRELISALRNPLFPAELSLQEAYGRAMDFGKSGSVSPAELTTAIHLVMNGIANEMENVDEN